MQLDPEDPLSTSLRHFRWALQRLVAVCVLLTLIALTLGCPHVQTSYQYRDTGRGYIPLDERDVVSATYLGPFGWRTLYAREFDQKLNAVLFIPVSECFD